MSAQRKPIKVSGLVSVRPADARPFRKPSYSEPVEGALEEAQPSDTEPDTVSLPIHLLDDSPDQYRLVYPIEELDALAMTLKEEGQIERIRVRAKSDGRYELITGHRRKRAGLIAGLTHLDAVVVMLDDKRAAIQVMLANESQEGVGDFERATGYQKLKAHGMNQSEIASVMGIGKSLVSMRLKFFELPSPILAALKDYPRAYAHHYVPILLDIIQESPDLVDTIAQDTVLVGRGERKPDVFISQLRQKQQKAVASTRPANTLSISNRDSRPILTMHTKPKGRVEIQLAPGMDQALFVKQLGQMLRDEAVKADSQLGEPK